MPRGADTVLNAHDLSREPSIVLFRSGTAVKRLGPLLWHPDRICIGKIATELSCILLASNESRNREELQMSEIHETVKPAEIEREARRQQQQLKAVIEVPLMPVIDICAGSPIPSGYIKTNDHWDPTKCGNPSLIVYNVWTITRYLDKPVGTIIDVCADAPVPAGWVVVGTRWDPTSCGHPTDIVQNIQRIQRVS